MHVSFSSNHIQYLVNYLAARNVKTTLFDNIPERLSSVVQLDDEIKIVMKKLIDQK